MVTLFGGIEKRSWETEIPAPRDSSKGGVAEHLSLAAKELSLVVPVPDRPTTTTHYYLTLTPSEFCIQKEAVWWSKEVRGHNLARGENAVARMAPVTPLSLPTLLPSSK